MPVIVIDTNILMADYALQGAGLKTLFEGSLRCGFSIFVPEVVFDELMGNYARRVRQGFDALAKTKTNLSQLLIDVDTPEPDLDERRQNYEAGIRTVFNVHGVEIAAYPDVPPKDLIVASYQGRKPFKDSGEGHKDFLIFRTILSVIDGADDSVWFLTNNYKDFCGEGDHLHPDLQAELPADRDVEIFRSAKDFNEQHIIPQLEELDGIATEIRDEEFDGFDLRSKARDCLESQLMHQSLSYESILDLLYGFNDDPTVAGIGDHEVDDLSVNRLSDSLLLITLNGGIFLELDGFMEKSDWYGMPEYESSCFSVSDSNWNEWVMMVSAMVHFHFEMSVVFDENSRDVDAVTVELSAAELT